MAMPVFVQSGNNNNGSCCTNAVRVYFAVFFFGRSSFVVYILIGIRSHLSRAHTKMCVNTQYTWLIVHFVHSLLNVRGVRYFNLNGFNYCKIAQTILESTRSKHFLHTVERTHTLTHIAFIW